MQDQVNVNDFRDCTPPMEECVGRINSPAADFEPVVISRNARRWLPIQNHDTIDGTTVSVSRIFDRFRDMRVNSLQSSYMTHTNTVRLEAPVANVQIVGTSRNVRRRLSIGNPHVVDITWVPVSRIFQRFKDMPVHRVEPDTKTQTVFYNFKFISNMIYFFVLADIRHSIGSRALLTPLDVSLENNNKGNVQHGYLPAENPRVQTETIHNAVSATNKPSTTNAHKQKYLQPASTLWSKEGSFSRNIKNVRCHPHFNKPFNQTQHYVMHMSYILLMSRQRSQQWSDSLSTATSKKNSSSRNVKRRSRSEEGNTFYRDLEEGNHPRFLQLYVYDTEDEVTNIISNFCGVNENTLNPEIVKGLIYVLDEQNGLVRLFRTARDRCNAGEMPGMKIRLYNKGGIRGYELPTTDTLGAIVFEDGSKSRTDFDVIIKFRGGPPQRISKLHQSYMSLQFPLLFTFGQPGFYPELVLKPRDGSGKGKKVKMNAYYNQLDYIRKNQADLRSDYLLGFYDAVSRGDREGIEVGSLIMLPSTFTGGPRYMYNHYLDALAICRSFGNPQFFITFTSNVKWPEIKRYMLQYPGLTTSDRADIVCRIFQQKVNDFLRFLKDVRPFGDVIAEFQKRGLPHCHTLFWVDSKTKIHSAKQIDEYISAEIPDPAEDPTWYKVGPDCILPKINRPIGEASTSTAAKTMIDKIQNYVDGRDRLDVIVNLPDKNKTTLTEWYVYNNENTNGRHLTYLDSPSEFIYPIYRAACEALGLLGDDREWDIALEESAVSATSSEIRTLFAQLLIYCEVSDPTKLWRKH
nr:DNA helicase [Tanacetum cinerariifolium]